MYIYREREIEGEKEERDIDIYMYGEYTAFGHKSNSIDDSHCGLCLTNYKSTEERLQCPICMVWFHICDYQWSDITFLYFSFDKTFIAFFRWLDLWFSVDFSNFILEAISVKFLKVKCFENLEFYWKNICLGVVCYFEQCSTSGYFFSFLYNLL